MESLPTLAPLGRFLGALVAWGLFFAASPGIAGRDGSAALAVCAAALWTWVSVHPLGERRRRGRLAEGLAGGLGGAALFWWVSYVVPFGLLYVVAGWGLYVVLACALLRALARSLPLPLAAALAWTGGETLRFVVPLPFGLGWLRLGHYAHAHLELAGMARVFGVEGLSFVLAALGGGIAALALERRLRRSTLAAALLPLAIGIATALLLRAPATGDGPRVLLVQPGFPQERKLLDDPRLNFASSRDLTFAALADLRARGEPEPDLVAWGESMLYVRLFDEEVEQAVHRGVRGPSWHDTLSSEFLADLGAAEDYWVRRELLGLHTRASTERRWPAGTSFSAGAETYDVAGDQIRRRVALVCYDAAGRRTGIAAKSHLVPLAETMWGFERFGWVRRLTEIAAGYVPDFLPARETGVLALETRAGKDFAFSGTLCFDNAFLDPYVEAVRRSGVDFHLVASNEAWYEESCEMDQMVAFSRLIALATGRSIVRATNSGVSLVIDPAGRELGRIESAGKDRAVAGTGIWTVPVPLEVARGPTPYVRLFAGIVGAFLLAPLAALLWGRRSARYRPSASG